MPDENDVQVSHKRLLDDIRSENNGDDSLSRRGYVESRERSSGEDEGGTTPTYYGGLRGAQRNAGPTRTPERPSPRVRSVDRKDIDPAKGTRTLDRGSEEPVKRQFKLKWPFTDDEKEKKPVKLFSNAEAEREFEHMKDIYFRGSGFLDDILEIVVKDHEPVQIWQLSEEEAAMLALNHLDRAKVDETAARSARVLLDIYDRIYFWMVVYPRMKLTGQHVIKHGGFSFK